MIASLVESIQNLERNKVNQETTFCKPSYIEIDQKSFPGMITIIVSK